MFLKLTFSLLGVAIVFEFLGPMLLQKFFPQALVAPAPEASARPKRAAARDSFVDEALEDVNNPANPLSNPAMMAVAASETSAESAAADEAMLLTGVDPNFNFEDYRTSGTAAGVGKHPEQAAIAAPTAQVQQVEVVQGIPDIFVDDETTLHA